MKVEFWDWNGEKGYVTDKNNEYHYNYQGDVNDVLAALVMPISKKGTSRPPQNTDTFPSDGITNFDPTEKTKDAMKLLFDEKKCHVIFRDGEQVK